MLDGNTTHQEPLEVRQVRYEARFGLKDLRRLVEGKLLLVLAALLVEANRMWKPVSGYEGLYEVSDTGQVRRVGGNVLKPQNESHGYLSVSLSKNGHKISKKIYRLVAVAFVENPENCNVVNHLDGNKHNDDAQNLEWTTIAGNNKHAWDIRLNHNTENQRLSASITGREAAKIAHEKNKRKIVCLNNGVVYESIKDAALSLGVDHSKISAVALGKRNHTSGYKFSYEAAQ